MFQCAIVINPEKLDIFTSRSEIIIITTWVWVSLITLFMLECFRFFYFHKLHRFWDCSLFLLFVSGPLKKSERHKRERNWKTYFLSFIVKCSAFLLRSRRLIEFYHSTNSFSCFVSIRGDFNECRWRRLGSGGNWTQQQWKLVWLHLKQTKLDEN